jgi:hypothetical protein
MHLSLEERCACFETRAFGALLSMRRFADAMHYVLILRSGPKDRVSKDARASCTSFPLLQAGSKVLSR